MTATGAFPDGSVTYGTSETFGVDCGCDGPQPTSTPGPVPLLNPTEPNPEETPAPDAGTGGVTATAPPFPVIGDSNDDSEGLNPGATDLADAAAVNGPGSVWSLAAAVAAAMMAVAMTGAWW